MDWVKMGFIPSHREPFGEEWGVLSHDVWVVMVHAANRSTSPEVAALQRIGLFLDALQERVLWRLVKLLGPGILIAWGSKRLVEIICGG